jgi:hypothetical protein
VTSKQPGSASERIDARLAERRVKLEKDFPGITALALTLKAKFGTINVRVGEMEGRGVLASPPSTKYISKRGRKNAER